MEEDHYSLISQEFLTILKDQYPLAKEILIDLESKERIKILSSFTDLRDVFDHFYIALDCALNDKFEGEKKDYIFQQITSAKEHFRRATVEPLETGLEDLLAKIIEKAKFNYFLKPLRFSSVSNKEIIETLKRATETLAEIRKLKGQLNQLLPTLINLKKSYDELRDFEKKLPTKITGRLVLGFLMFGFFCFLLGIVLNTIFR